MLDQNPPNPEVSASDPSTSPQADINHSTIAENYVENQATQESFQAAPAANHHKSKSGLPLRLLLIVLIVAVLGGGVFYKYSEWQTLHDFNQLYQESLFKDLDTLSEASRQGDEMFYAEENEDEKEETKAEVKSKKDVEAILAAAKKKDLAEYDAKLGDFKLYNETLDRTIKVFQDHQKEYQDFASKQMLTVGKSKKEFIKQMAETMNKYYESEIKDLENQKVMMALSTNEYVILKDYTIMQYFMVETADVDASDLGSYFSNLATLEKYTRDDFTYEQEDKIKELYPYGYESLNKQIQFLKTFYLGVKDLVAGDTDSAAYKFSRLDEDRAAVAGVDYDKIEDETKEIRIELNRSSSEALLKRMELAQDFNSKKMGLYPGLKTVDDWKSDLATCQLMIYKVSLYEVMKSEYPPRTSLDELLKSIGQINPKTDTVDSLVNKETMTLDTSKKDRFSISCKAGDKTYVSIFHPDEEEDEEEVKKDEDEEAAKEDRRTSRETEKEE